MEVPTLSELRMEVPTMSELMMEVPTFSELMMEVPTVETARTASGEVTASISPTTSTSSYKTAPCNSPTSSTSTSEADVGWSPVANMELQDLMDNYESYREVVSTNTVSSSNVHRTPVDEVRKRRRAPSYMSSHHGVPDCLPALGSG